MEQNEQMARTDRDARARWEDSYGPRQLARWEEESHLTWEQAVRVLRKHRTFLTSVIGVLILIIVIVALLLRDVYQPTARLEIDPLGGGIKTLHEIENPRPEADSDYLDTQVQILESDGLAMRVIRNLRLDQNPEFVKKNALANLPATSSGEARKTLSQTGGSFLQEQLELANPTPAESSALRAFHKKLYVNPVRGSRLVEVSFAAHDPLLAQAATNTLVSQFMEQNYRNRYMTTMEASDWLSTQLNDLRSRVAESNRAVAHYQKEYGLVESDDRDVPMAQLMAEVSRQLSEAQADRIQAEAFVRLVDLGQAETVPTVRDDAVYQSLLTRYADTRASLAKAKAVYGDENTNVKKLQNEADELQGQLDAERTRLTNRVRASFDAARAREQMMMESRERLRAQMGDASSHLVEYQMLKNEAVANATLYNTLEARLREAGIYAGLRSGNIHVVDMAANLHEPTSPHRALIVGIGAILSVMAGLALVFVRESFDNTVRIPDDIRQWIRLPSLGVLPVVNGATKSSRRVLRPGAVAGGLDLTPGVRGFPEAFWADTHSEGAEAIRALRVAVLSPVKASAPQVILVSSANGGEGKTTVALNLANALARQGKTCLIDGDLRSPKIESALNLSPQAGLAEVLTNRVTVNDVLVRSESIPGLSVIPIKALPEAPSDLIASSQMRDVVETLRQSFDYVVIDSPPLIPYSDGLSLARLADAVVLVTRYASTTRRALLRSMELLAEIQAPVAGVVLNAVDFDSADYHYFNYGYSSKMNGAKYEYARRQGLPPVQSSGGEDGPEKSRGAHA